jgi:NAD(P)-dependent dehydrogenase (short-subunit alcohol dehydrogenase family)
MSDEHRVALVTGGGSGIGAATARKLAADGYGVVVTGRRQGLLAAVAGEIGGLAVVADTTVEEDAIRAVAETVARFGRLDALVLNAGAGGPGSLLDADPTVFDAVVRVNLTGSFLAARAAIPHLVESHGSIVSVASVAALRAAPSSLAYCASKAALVMLTRCIALDHGAAGVRANCVCPGWTRTALADGEMDALAGELEVDREAAYVAATRHVPLGRPCTPEEVAGGIAWLLSPAASYVNGAVLTIDGGSTVVDVAATVFTGVGM